MIVIYDNGESYSAHEISFVDIGDLPKDDVIALMLGYGRGYDGYPAPMILGTMDAQQIDSAAVDPLWKFLGLCCFFAQEKTQVGELRWVWGLQPKPFWATTPAPILSHLYRAWSAPESAYQKQEEYRRCLQAFREECERRGIKLE